MTQYTKGKLKVRNRCPECKINPKDCDCDFKCPSCQTLGEYNGDDHIICPNDSCRVMRFFTQ